MIGSGHSKAGKVKCRLAGECGMEQCAYDRAVAKSISKLPLLLAGGECSSGCVSRSDAPK